MEEIFRIITDFENYEVSNMGNVRVIKTKKILNLGYGTGGYCKVELYFAGKRVTKRIHRLVAETFLENPDDKSCVDHIDNNRLNNNLTNLRYATKNENQQNRKLNINNTSGQKGVIRIKNKWHAYIGIDGILVHLGSFTNKEDAIQARIIKANAAFGVFVNSCEKV